MCKLIQLKQVSIGNHEKTHSYITVLIDKILMIIHEIIEIEVGIVGLEVLQHE